MAANKNIGELLVRESIIDIDQLENARREQKNHGGRLITALVRMGHIKEKDLTDFLGRQYQLPTIDLGQFEIDPDVLKLVSRQVCEKHRVIPVSKAGRSLVVAFADPSNIFVKDDLSLLTRHKIEVVVAPETSIISAIEKYYGKSDHLADITTAFDDSDEDFEVTPDSSDAAVVDGAAGANEGPIIQFVNAMLAEAIKSKASDIHIESYEKRFRIRFRVDGTLVEKTQPPQGAAGAVVSRIKILSKMNIAERRRPQDGRLKVKMKNGMDVDFRVNSLPTLFGEKVVLRLLDKSNLQVDLTKLGFEQAELDRFILAIRQPQGMVLITGPTGSGKTTTIYSAIAELNTPQKNVSTAEDPVEFNLDGINQVQINAEIGFDFAATLRAFLRQDPDVIMVGEIRDLETAEVAYKAASTGHMVVSTLHTNDAASTITRLLDMGLPPYVVAEATTLVVAQRLIKKICDVCKVDHEIPDEVLLDLGVKQEDLSEYKNLKRGEGCPRCNHTGMAGRMAIFEVMSMTGAVKDAIFKGASPLELKRHAVLNDKMKTLRQNALLKLKQGLTTVEQVISVSVKDDL